jgi:hypothetical protein
VCLFIRVPCVERFLGPMPYFKKMEIFFKIMFGGTESFKTSGACVSLKYKFCPLHNRINTINVFNVEHIQCTCILLYSTHKFYFQLLHKA